MFKCVIIYGFVLFMLENSLFANDIDTTISESKYKKYLYIEPQIYYPQYYIYSSEYTNNEKKIKFKNKFNYGLGTLISLRVGKLKFSGGFSISTKSYITTNNVKEKIMLYHIPLVITFSCGNINPFFSLKLNNPFYYNNFNNESNKKELLGNVYSETIKPTLNKSKSAISGVSYNLTNKKDNMQLNIKVYCEYIKYNKENLEFDVFFSDFIGNGHGSYKIDKSVSLNQFNIGIEIGIQFLLVSTKY